MAIPAPIFLRISIATARLDKTPEKMWHLPLDQTKYFIALKLSDLWLS